MTELDHDFEARKQQFDRLVLLEYYEAVERDEAPNQEELIAKYPEFAVEWRSFFEDLCNIIGAAPELPTQSTAPNAPSNIRDYQLLKKIGEGGMGSVYLAIHTQLEKRVAIKILKGDRESDTKRFAKEIRAVGRVEHDHVVRALDAGKADGLHYLVMEYIDGVDLSQLLAHGAPLPIAEACELARQSALGIGHAHQHGMIHRDIKPSNLMLSSSGQVKLLDLGLAQLQQTLQTTTRLTIDGLAMGTLKYMAPEQFIDCKNVDATSDIYSLGVTLFELLHGELPTNGVRAVVDCEDLRVLRSEISEDLIELIRSMTAEQSSSRIQCADEVADRLACWSNDHDLKPLFRRCDQQRRQSIHPPPIPPASRTSVNDQTEINASGGRWSSKRVQGTKVLAVIFLAAIVAPFLIRPATDVGPNQDPAAESEATLFVVIDGDANGDLFLAIDESSGRPYQLTAGLNQVPPGSYELKLDGWTSSSPSPILLERSSPQLLMLTPPDPVNLEFPVQFPEIPRTAGAWARFNASVIPLGAKEHELEPYRVVLRCLETEYVGDREFQWIRTDLSNHEYHETATLLIDAELYASEQELAIHEGWIEADLPKDAPPIETFDGQRLTVRWNDEKDLLDELAKDWDFRWPASRISTQSLLTMIFELSHPAVPKQFGAMRSLLGSSSKPRVKEIQSNDTHGSVKSLSITTMSEHSSSSGGKIGYTIERAIDGQNTPFSFLHVEIHSPQVRVTLRRSVGSLKGQDHDIDRDRLDSAADDLAKLIPPEFGDFTRASLPDKEGDVATYIGTVQRGPTTLEVRVKVRAGSREPADDGDYRWIEVEVISGDQNQVERVTERVKLLIDETAYRENNEFSVTRGWHELNGEVFDFRAGNATPAEHALAWLEQSPAERFPVHAVLTLLFDANLHSSGLAKRLRSSLTASVQAGTAERRRTRKVLDDASGNELALGWWVEFEPRIDHVIEYNIGWSENVPFGFVSVFLKAEGMFEISTAMKGFGSQEELLENDSELSARAAATQERLTDLGVRIWATKDPTTPYLVGHYEDFSNGKVTIDTTRGPFVGGPEIEFHDLSDADQDWILKSKSEDWSMKDGKIVRGLYSSFDGPKQELSLLLEETGHIAPIAKRNLSDDAVDKLIRKLAAPNK